MKLLQPSFEDLREILGNPEPGIAAELDAFYGRGVWDVDGHAAHLAALARALPSHLIVNGCDEPVLAMGLTLERAGVVQTWFVGRADWMAHDHKIRACYQAIVAGLFEAGIHRIQVQSLAGRPRVREWFERMGYVYEGTQRAAGAQGEDFDLYGLVAGGAHVRRGQ